MRIPIFQVDAFTDHLFGGNPAGVVPLKSWLPDDMMQLIGMENNLSETAFFVPEGDDFRIRWFTPLAEVDLCGHATLASAHVLFNHLNFQKEMIRFHSRSGLLKVSREGTGYTLNFPYDEMKRVNPPEELLKAMKKKPADAFKGKTDFMLVYESQEDISTLEPDMDLIVRSGARGLIVTAPGNDVDFVSRFFAPMVGIPEDPVTGSAHTSLTPYWSKRMSKTELTAIQLSKRMGHLVCRLVGDRVEVSGEAVTFFQGEMFLKEDEK